MLMLVCMLRVEDKERNRVKGDFSFFCLLFLLIFLYLLSFPFSLSLSLSAPLSLYLGIGFEIAKSLASMKPRKLILSCRNIDKAKAAEDSIKLATGFEAIETWKLDLASFASVRAFAKRFIDSQEPLDLLVSNAGLVSTEWAKSEDGFEITYA